MDPIFYASDDKTGRTETSRFGGGIVRGIEEPETILARLGFTSADYTESVRNPHVPADATDRRRTSGRARATRTSASNSKPQ